MEQRARIVVGILGLDQHEVGAIAVARMLRDAGMEVIYTGKFSTPARIVQTSIQEDVHAIGLSCHSWEYLYYVPELLELMKKASLGIPLILGGSVITPDDEVELRAMGVAACFGPGSSDEDIVQGVRRLVQRTD